MHDRTEVDSLKRFFGHTTAKQYAAVQQLKNAHVRVESIIYPIRSLFLLDVIDSDWIRLIIDNCPILSIQEKWRQFTVHRVRNEARSRYE